MISPGYCRLLLLLGVAVLLQTVPSAAAAAAVQGAPAADAGDDCTPVIANKCFVEVAKDLACQRDPRTRNSSECLDRDAVDMCYSLDDALNCTSDIIDGDCSATDGRLMYDNWLSGLRGVQRHLCANNATNMRGLIKPTDCWDPTRYLDCLEQAAQITHVTDLLKVKLDLEECGRIQRAVSSCAVADSPRCRPAAPPGGLDTALTAFLLETPCQAACWRRPAPPHVRPASFRGTTLAIVLLAALALLLGGMLLLFTHRTSCFRIPLARR